jgi:hypothetical protein
MKPRNVSMKMLSTIDVIELSNRFTLDEIAATFICSTQYVRNCIMRQELQQNKSKREFEYSRKGNGAWKELKEIALFQQIMNR